MGNVDYKPFNIVTKVNNFESALPSGNDYLTFNTSLEESPTAKGSVYWDDQDETLTVIMNDAGVKLQLGQEQYINAVNKTGSEIANGTVVYVSGAQGNRTKIDLADCDTELTSSKTIGVATETIANNGYGKITTFGLVRDLNTSAYSEGDCLWLSSTPGVWTDEKPADGKFRYQIGMVVKSHVTDGWVCVKIHNIQYMFGDVDSGNYSYFEEDGTLVAKGNATVWDDMNGSALQVEVQGTGVSIDETENSLDFTTASNLSDYGYDNYQTPHKMKAGSNLYPHIHWVQKEDNVPNFLIQYRYQTNGQATETSWTNLKCNTPVFTYTSGSLNQICYTDAITGNGLPSIIEFRVLRDNSNTSAVFSGSDPYTQTANVKFIDIYVEIDTQGSRQQYVK